MSAPKPAADLDRLRLGRFRLGGTIGTGGMGRVHEAHDPHLQRTVAVKVLHADDPVSVRRFLREARIQGSLSHPGICPIYEAGEADGTPYIVMRRIPGRPFDEVAAELSVEQRLRLMAQVADAVHVAHREGLIHRDLKPGNILVEPKDDGAMAASVLDFGLARGVSERMLTRAGEGFGTPGYMAPEQIRGNGDLDRRTDVYALGATLYRVLASRPPTTESGPGLAPSLRRLGIPREVEAIVFRCLESDPDRRYGSARALADDLRRYLDGRPVTARSAGTAYRLRKHLARNRVAWALAVLASALVVAGIGWGLMTRFQATQRERLARGIGEQVREIEALARYAHMAPLHDLGPDRAILRQRIEVIRKQSLGRGGRGFLPISNRWRDGWGGGDYAIGRGLLALGDAEGALEALERAWQAGYRSDDSAVALAEASSALYREKLIGAELVRDWEARRQRVEDLDRRYGDRVVARLSAVAGSPYLDALVHFHRERYDEALAILERAPDRPAWGYEWARLEADIWRSRGIRAASEGDDEAALEAWREAQNGYALASGIAPSEPAIHRATAQAAYLILQLRMLSGDDPTPILESGLAALERATRADPDAPRNGLWRARLLRTAASARRARAEDPTAMLDQALGQARSAARGARATTEAQIPVRGEIRGEIYGEIDAEIDAEIARIHWGRAQWMRERGEDPTAALEAGAAAFDRVPSAARGYEALHTLGLLRMTLGDHRLAHGQPAAADYALASAAFDAAAARHSKPFAVRSNQGVALFKRARALPSDVALPALREAIDAFETARALDPDHVAPLYYLGRANLLLAQGGRPTTTGLDPEIAWRAVAFYEQGLEVAPKMFQLWSGLGEVFHLLALAAWDRGEDPAPDFERARERYREGLAVAPGSATIRVNLAWVSYFEGKVRWRRDEDPEPYFEAALGHLGPASPSPGLAGDVLCRASIWRIRAERWLAHGRDPWPALRKSRLGLEALLRANPNHAEGHRSLGRLATLEGRALMRQGADPRSAFDTAASAIDRATVLAPDVDVNHLAKARLALRRLEWLGADSEDGASSYRSGIESADRALALRPGWPEARALRAVLSMAVGAGADQGIEALRAALDDNPHLRPEWRTHLVARRATRQ